MKKISLIILFSFILISNAFADDQFKIGVSLALTGEGANAGNACKNGITLALEHLPQDLRNKISVELEDDGMVPKNTVSVFNKFVDLSKINAMISFTSGCSNSVAALAEKKQIPLLAIATDPKVVQDKKFVFNIWVTPETESKLLAEEIIKRKYKKIAKITAIHDMYIAVNKTLDQTLGDKVQTVLNEEYSSDAKDFKPFLTKLKSYKDVDAVFVGLWFGQVGIFAKQAKELGIKLPLFGYELFEDPNEVKLSQGGLLGQFYVNTDDPVDSFMKEYNTRFPNAAGLGSANCHDAIILFANAYKKNNSNSPEGIVEYLENLRDFSGALGLYSSTGDHRFSIPATMKVVTKNGFEKLNK